MLVQDIMKKEVVTLTPNDSVREALLLLADRRIRHLPIIDAHRRVVGIVSDRDLKDASPSILALHEDDADILNTPLTSIMKKEVITCHPLDFVEEAAFTLYHNRIGCLPVLQNDQLVGILTESDILHTLVELMGIHQPSSHIEVEVPDRAGVLADVASVFKECKSNVSSVLVYPGKGAHTKRLVFRVQTMDPRKALQILKNQGYHIIWPAENPYLNEGKNE